MSRSWTVGSVVIVCLISGLIGVNYVSSHPQLPQSLEAKNCASSAPPGELANARFARKGGRTTRNVKVWRQGSALMIDDVAQGRDLTQYERLELADPEPRVVSDQRRDPVLAQARSAALMPRARHTFLSKQMKLAAGASTGGLFGTAKLTTRPQTTRWNG